MKTRLVPYLCASAIGVTLGTAGITWSDWQLYCVLILTCIGEIAAYAQGWSASIEKAIRIAEKFERGGK